MRLEFARICPRFPTVSRRRPKSDRLLVGAAARVGIKTSLVVLRDVHHKTLHFRVHYDLAGKAAARPTLIRQI